MSTEQILSEEDVREIEAHFHLTTDGDAVFVLSRAPALCQTVRALREQMDRLNALGEEMLSRLEVAAGIGRKADHGWYFVVGAVESRLSEVTKERDDLRAELEKIKGAGVP